MDWIGPLPMSKHKNQYIFTCVDVVSRYACAMSFSAQSTKNTVCALNELWLNRYGLPKVIMHDNGSVFTSTNMKLLCEQLSIKQHCVLPYAAQSNGICERFIGTLKQMIGRFI